MKKLVVLFILFTASFAFAASNVSFIWDPNTEVDLEGYRVFRSNTSGGPYTMVGEIPCGPNDSVCSKFTELGVPDGTYFWVARAYDTEGFESENSTEATDRLDSTAPSAPQNLTIYEKVVAWIEDGGKKLYGWVKKFFENNSGFRVAS